MARGWIILVPMLGLAACSYQPMDYIPPTDRALLEAQARLSPSGNGQGPISVKEMLNRARDSQADAEHPLVLTFVGDTVQPDAAQVQLLQQFAAKVHGQAVTVTSQPGGFDDPGSLLGPRRAVAVAHELSASLPTVGVRFSAEAPAHAVVVRASPAAPKAQP